MYSNQLRLFSTDEAAPTVAAELWRHYTTVNDGLDHDALVETSSGPATSAGTYSWNATFSFAEGPTFFVPGDETNRISLALRLDGTSGLIFRSGVMDVLATPFPDDENGFVNAFVLDGEVPQADVQAGATAALPYSPPDFSSATIDSATATLGDGTISVTASGSATDPAGVITLPFTYTTSLTVEPSLDLRRLERYVVVADAGTPRLTFTGGAATPAWASTLANALAPFAGQHIAPQVAAGVTDRIDGIVLQRVREQLAPNATQLPAGVGVSVAEVNIRPEAIWVLAAVGCFGSLSGRLGISGSGGISCPFTTIAALAAPGLTPALFRAYRNESLARSALGRALTASYYRRGPRLSRVLAANPGLLARGARLARAAEAELRARGRLSPGLVARAALLTLLAEASRYSLGRSARAASRTTSRVRPVIRT